MVRLLIPDYNGKEGKSCWPDSSWSHVSLRAQRPQSKGANEWRFALQWFILNKWFPCNFNLLTTNNHWVLQFFMDHSLAFFLMKILLLDVLHLHSAVNVSLIYKVAINKNPSKASVPSCKLLSFHVRWCWDMSKTSTWSKTHASVGLVSKVRYTKVKLQKLNSGK